MSALFKKYNKFKNDQKGSATIEFVLLFPAFMMMFLMGFESGYFMVRNVMLERALDISVRDVRLANGTVPELAELKANICQVALILPDCENSLQIEIRPVAPLPGGVASAGTLIRCIDKAAEPNDPNNETIYDTGSGNQLMLVRVCALANPLFPTTGIGAGLKFDTFGNYALVATTAFVNEPGDSTDRAAVAFESASVGGGNNGYGNGDQDAPGYSLNNNSAENDQSPGGNGGGNNP